VVRQPIRWEPPEERPPLPPKVFEGLVDALAELLLADVALDEAQTGAEPPPPPAPKP
jgi:hypothetical protein